MRYRALTLDEEICKCTGYSGLWLNPQELAAHDFGAVDAILACGLVSLEHAVFLEQLATYKQPN